MTTSKWRAVWRSAFGVATAGALVAASAPSLAQETADARSAPSLTVEVRGARNDHGRVRVGLFSRRAHFLDEGFEIATCLTEIHRGVARCDLGDVPVGTYAIAFFHDEDEDGHFGRDWVGLPSEGYGFSNDAPTHLAPPSFDDARFTVAGPTVHVMHVRYGL